MCKECWLGSSWLIEYRRSTKLYTVSPPITPMDGPSHEMLTLTSTRAPLLDGINKETSPCWHAFPSYHTHSWLFTWCINVVQDLEPDATTSLTGTKQLSSFPPIMPVDGPSQDALTLMSTRAPFPAGINEGTSLISTPFHSITPTAGSSHDTSTIAEIVDELDKEGTFPIKVNSCQRQYQLHHWHPRYLPPTAFMKICSE